MEIQKFEYIESKKSFLDEIKFNFHSFWRATIGEKFVKKQRTQALKLIKNVVSVARQKIFLLFTGNSQLNLFSSHPMIFKYVKLVERPAPHSLEIPETVDKITFTEEILNGRLHFLCSVARWLKSRIRFARKFRDFWLNVKPRRGGGGGLEV